MTTPDDVRYVSAETLRRLFNESQFPTMIAQGLLQADYLRNSHLEAPESRGEPFCTHAQMVRYLDQNARWTVEVSQYLRPDGNLGASGKPDPKRLRLGGTIFILDVRPSPA